MLEENLAVCCSFSEVPGANPSTPSCVVAGLMSTHGVLLGGHRSFLLPFVLDWDGYQDHTEAGRSSHLLGVPMMQASHISRKKEKVTAGDRYVII